MTAVQQMHNVAAVGPIVGEDGFIPEPHTLSVVLKCLPREVRSAASRKQAVVYTCLDVSQQYLAMGSEQGYVWILDLRATKLVRELSDFRGTPVTVVALNAQQEHVAFGTQDGQTKIDAFTKQMSRGYRIQEKDRQRVVAMTWDDAGTTLLSAYSSGKLIKASFQFSGEAMEVVPLLECGSCVVQLSLSEQSLLISTLARSLLLDMNSGRVTQVGTKERKSGSFGGCLSCGSLPDKEGVAPTIVAYLARPGLRMWTADDTGKVTLTTKFRGPLTSGQFPHVPTHNWSSGTPQFTETWQFSLVLPWLSGLVVTHSDRTLCILDPTTSTVAGVLCLEHPITCVSVSGKFVYILSNDVSRPLARFTAHASYLKNLQKTTKSVASGVVGSRSEEDLLSVTTDEGDGENRLTVGGREWSSVSVGTRDSEESERFVKEGESRERSVISAVSETTEIQVENTPETQDLEEPTPNSHYNPTLTTVEKPVRQLSEDAQGTRGDREVLTPGLPEEPLCQDGAPDDKQTHPTLNEENTDTGNSLPDQVENETTPDSMAQEEDQLHRDEDEKQDPHVGEPEPDRDSETPPTAHPAAQPTAGSSRGPGRQHYTDPPSVTGPMGVQDLAREVTDLLRPALGKLTTLMKDRKREGGAAGSGGAVRAVSPHESPLVERQQSEREEREGEGEREERQGTPLEGPSPKLILKLGGKLGELISGERDKERDSPLSSGTASVGMTPTVIGPEEEERRLRMAQAAGEEDTVAERLTQKKKRKRRTKKHSKPDSTSSSLERLTDIGDGGVVAVEGDTTTTTPVASPHVEPVSDTDKVVLGEMEGEERSSEATKLSALIEKEELVSSLNKLQPEPTTRNSEAHPQTTRESPHAHTLEQDSARILADKVEEIPMSLSEEVSLPVGDEIAPTLTLTTTDLLIEIPETFATESTAHTGEGEAEDLRDKREKEKVRRERVHSPLSPKSQLVNSVEVTFGADPLSQLNDDDNGYFKPAKMSRSSTTPTRRKKPEKVGYDGPRQLVSGDQVPLELSDNPLYGDDTSDFTTDTDSSQQRSRRGSSAKPRSSSRGSSSVPITSSSSSAAFSAKHMRTKGGPSLGVSPAVSDLSWDSSLQVPRPRSERVFTPSASPFEVSNSPVDLSSSYHSSSSNTLQAPRSKLGAASYVSQSHSSSLHFKERQPLPLGDDSGSDYSGDENETQMEQQSEQFSLCAAAVEERRPSPAVTVIKSPSPFSTSVSRHRSPFDNLTADRDQVEESAAASSARESSPDPDADIWVTVPHPSRGQVQSICLSDHLLWLVDSRHLVYCTKINTKGKKWELIKHQMQQISSSASGSVVWGMYRQNAYVRQGVNELNKLGNVWMNMTKGSSLAQKIKCVCADEEGIWVVKTDGQIIFRKGVSPRTPQGRVWVEVGRAAGFTSVAACSGVVWATNASGRLFYREGVTEQIPSGKKWTEMKAPPLDSVCMTQGNIAWIIDGEGKMGFRGGVSRSQPTGKNPWWEVTVSTTLSHSSLLPFNSLWQVMTSEGSQFLSSVSSLIHTHLPGHHKLLAVSASTKAGVCVLESGSKLHACWRSTTGYHYSSASKDGVFQLTTWTMFGSGSTGLWVVRDDGELYCVTPQDKFVRIECASTVQMMAVSSTALWVIANNQLWSRQGMTAALPEGISWDYIELSPLLHQRKLKDIVCGKRAVWAVDGSGVPHFRFGVHSREPGTGMSPAWVPVDDLSHSLQQITVSNNDWLVWAIDENCNSYVRTGVTPDFPVGTAWDVVPGQPVKQLCAHGRKVYALTPSGNLLCRYGITETNMQGNYWRQLPGNFVQISIGHSGVLLGLDSKGSILKQQCRTLTVAQDSEFLMHGFDQGGLDNSWEVV